MYIHQYHTETQYAFFVVPFIIITFPVKYETNDFDGMNSMYAQTPGISIRGAKPIWKRVIIKLLTDYFVSILNEYSAERSSISTDAGDYYYATHLSHHIHLNS